ncbi:universal stress protein [Haladaptatus sp. F3-133]|uniref:Universal stress protein n=1 Tax=Halorutilus salinus TaxID=2487751 RepID=A0A9Q4C461_9EURY|nr:universal stress protein [Halorutilus salinus]MCX2819123.1 universal stress protein [Halorutilus salinus]
MYDNILVPTDGSETAEVAVEHAVEMAKRYEATLHTLYVVDIDAVNFSLGTEQLDRLKSGGLDEMDDVKEGAEEATGRVADRASEEGVDVVEEVRAGTPHDTIVKYAENNGIDVIVMGSHGRGGVKRALLGSVAERVLRTTHLPVFVVDVEE